MQESSSRADLVITPFTAPYRWKPASLCACKQHEGIGLVLKFCFFVAFLSYGIHHQQPEMFWSMIKKMEGKQFLNGAFKKKIILLGYS